MTDTPLVASAATRYPERYYVSFDSASAQPTSVLGWFDMWDMSNLVNVPSQENLVAITSEEWGARQLSGVGVQEGKLVAYTPPVPKVSLPTQAQNELSWIYTQGNLAAASGKKFTDAMKVYVDAIQAIANGTDTTSTALPARPSVIMA